MKLYDSFQISIIPQHKSTNFMNKYWFVLLLMSLRAKNVNKHGLSYFGLEPELWFCFFFRKLIKSGPPPFPYYSLVIHSNPLGIDTALRTLLFKWPYSTLCASHIAYQEAVKASRHWPQPKSKITSQKDSVSRFGPRQCPPRVCHSSNP